VPNALLLFVVFFVHLTREGSFAWVAARRESSSVLRTLLTALCLALFA